MVFKLQVPDDHGRGTDYVRPGTLKAIMAQLNLDRAQFQQWFECPMEARDYEVIARERFGL